MKLKKNGKTLSNACIFLDHFSLYPNFSSCTFCSIYFLIIHLKTHLLRFCIVLHCFICTEDLFCSTYSQYAKVTLNARPNERKESAPMRTPRRLINNCVPTVVHACLTHTARTRRLRWFPDVDFVLTVRTSSSYSRLSVPNLFRHFIHQTLWAQDFFIILYPKNIKLRNFRNSKKCSVFAP